MYKIAERQWAILLQVGLNCLTVSESSLTPPPFACSKCYSSNNILNKLCSGITPYFMWGLQALAGIPWERRLKKNHKSRSHSTLFFSSTICLCSSMVDHTEAHEGWKSSYVNFWSGKKSQTSNLPSGRISPPESPFVTPFVGEKHCCKLLRSIINGNQHSSLPDQNDDVAIPVLLTLQPTTADFEHHLLFSRREALSVKTIVSNDYFICTTSQNQHFKFLIQYFIKKAWYL